MRGLPQLGEKVSAGDSGLPWPQVSRFLWSIGPSVARALTVDGSPGREESLPQSRTETTLTFKLQYVFRHVSVLKQC